MVNQLKNYWRKFLTKLGIGIKKWDIPDGHVIEPVFVSGGKQFYRLKDTMNTCLERGLGALTVYEEIESRVTRPVLQEFVKRMEDIINDPKGIKIGELAQLIGKLKERMDWVVPPSELIWKFASVIYFDENESPFVYDAKYCTEKIARWKEAGDIAPFFFHSQLKDLLPLIQLSPEDLEILQKVIDQMNELPILTSTSTSASNPPPSKPS